MFWPLVVEGRDDRVCRTAPARNDSGYDCLTWRPCGWLASREAPKRGDRRLAPTHSRQVGRRSSGIQQDLHRGAIVAIVLAPAVERSVECPAKWRHAIPITTVLQRRPMPHELPRHLGASNPCGPVQWRPTGFTSHIRWPSRLEHQSHGGRLVL